MACEACAEETNGGTNGGGLLGSTTFFELLIAVLVIGILVALFHGSK